MSKGSRIVTFRVTKIDQQNLDQITNGTVSQTIRSLIAAAAQKNSETLVVQTGRFAIQPK